MTVTEFRGAPSWTLLAVDGDPYILAALRRVVRPMGWRILTTGRAEDAMALLAIHPIDAVLSDLRMPDMDGLELLERVSRGWPCTARVLLTARPDAAMLIDAINHGQLHGCIVKPWADDALVAMLRRIVQRRRIETAGRSDELGAAPAGARTALTSTTTSVQHAPTLCLRTSYLRAGQTLAQDFVSPEGVLLLSAGNRLSEDLIHRIQAFERKHGLSLTLVVQTAPQDAR